MNATKYDKLVRDKIPGIIEKGGKHAVVRTLGTEEYKKYLDKKLGEELQEYLASDSAEELADLVEVVHAVLKYKGIGMLEFEQIRKKKAEERGTFDKRLILEEVVG